VQAGSKDTHRDFGGGLFVGCGSLNEREVVRVGTISSQKASKQHTHTHTHTHRGFCGGFFGGFGSLNEREVVRVGNNSQVHVCKQAAKTHTWALVGDFLLALAA
jgi:hypothetical protein